ncbi:MAG: DMT family transporter [Pseudomonadota bacterium]
MTTDEPNAPDTTEATSKPEAHGQEPPADRNLVTTLGQYFFNTAPLLLVLTMSFWAANGLLGKWVALTDDLPPVGLAFWRWTLAMVLIFPFARPHLKRDWPAVKAGWCGVLILSVFGIGAFNTLIYWSQYSTSAVNLFLLNAALPLLIPALSFILFRDRVGALQAVGIGLALMGAVTIISTGDPAVLWRLHINPGDALVLLAMISYAIYSVCLRLKPAVHPMTLLLVTFFVGTLFLLPLYVWEHLYVGPINLTPKSLVAIGYVAIFPSFLAYLFFNRGVELIGANRASLYFHLMPLIGTVLALLLFQEPVDWYHGVGAVLIITGLVLGTGRLAKKHNG